MKKSLKSSLKFVACLSAAAALPCAASAGDIFWPSGETGSLAKQDDGFWRDGSATGAVTNAPTASDTVRVGSGTVTVNEGENITFAALGLEYGEGTDFTMSGGNLTISGETMVGRWGSGTAKQTGGTWRTGSLVMGFRPSVTNTLELAGGEFIITGTGESRIAYESYPTANPPQDKPAKLILSGATVTASSSSLRLGNSRYGNSITGIVEQTRGNVTLKDLAVGYGYGSQTKDDVTTEGPSVGIYEMKGGTLTMTDDFSLGAKGGVGIFHQTGGTVIAQGDHIIFGGDADNTTSVTEFILDGGTFTKEGGRYFNFGNKNLSRNTLTINAGTFTVEAANYGFQLSARSTVNLNGGTLAIPKTQRDGSTETDELVFNFNGGEILSIDNSAALISASEKLALNVLEGGAIFNIPEGQSRVISQPFVSAVASGETDGGFTKRGKGVLKLGALPGWNGVTRVEEGQFEGTGDADWMTLTTPIAIAEAGKWYHVNRDTADLTAIGTWTNAFKITDYTQGRTTLDRFCVEGGSVKLYDGTFEATNLVLTTGAVLDLNGGTMTIKNLSGEGAVTNGTVVFIGGGEIKPTGAIKLPGGATLSGTLYATIDENGALAGSIAFDGAITLDGLNLVVTGEENFDKDAKLYTLVSGSSVSGSLGTVTGITAGGRWNAQKRGTSVAISYSEGFVLRIR